MWPAACRARADWRAPACRCTSWSYRGRALLGRPCIAAHCLAVRAAPLLTKTCACCRKMFTTLWMWREEYQHHEQLPLAFNGTWPSWNSDLDNRPW